MNYEIIRKEWKLKWSKGEVEEIRYFIKDDFSILNGPYDSVEEAEKDLPRRVQLQNPLSL